MAHLWRGVLTEYRDRLPVGPSTPVVTLGEGGTPLTRARTLSDITSCDVWIKFEGANPTGSFKDRGMTMAISAAAEALVLPVEAQMIAFDPSSTALDTAMVMPRSLKEPVGLAPSTLR